MKALRYADTITLYPSQMSPTATIAYSTFLSYTVCEEESHPASVRIQAMTIIGIQQDVPLVILSFCFY